MNEPGLLAIVSCFVGLAGAPPTALQKKHSGRSRPLLVKPMEQSYFGGGVVVSVPAPFLLFLPPLWPFFPPFLPFLASSVAGAFPLSAPPVVPPVCAKLRLPASNSV